MAREAIGRFARYREIRKTLAEAEAVPAYAIFTNKELAAIAELEEVNPVTLKKIPGIGDKKIAKYGEHFIKVAAHET